MGKAIVGRMEFAQPKIRRNIFWIPCVRAFIPACMVISLVVLSVSTSWICSCHSHAVHELSGRRGVPGAAPFDGRPP